MLVYNKYINSRDYSWYDSSNILFSECIDTQTETKTLKITFKNGRTYLYKDVDVTDYLIFRNAESNGKAFNTNIKKYDFVRLPDVELEKLDEMRKEFQEDASIINEAMSNLQYHIDMNPDTKEFRLSLNGKTIYEGIEDNVNISRLFKSMSISYSMGELTEPLETFKEEILN